MPRTCFGRHVGDGAHGAAGAGEMLGGAAQRGAFDSVHGDFGGGRARAGEGHFGETKVKNFGVAALGDKKIGGLDVAVNDVCGVRRIERVGDFDGEGEEVFDVHRAAVDAVLERLAIEKFHGDEGVAIPLADIVNRADVGVVQRAEVACASRWNRARACESLATSCGRNFSATKRLRRESSAL